MSRKHLGLVLGGLALVALLVFRAHVPSPRTATEKVIDSTSVAKANSPQSVSPPAPSTVDMEAERRLRMISGSTNRSDFQLTPAEIYVYLEANHSNAVSLVTAFQATHDAEFLKRAA